MARIHPAALNMAFATVEPKAPPRCRCWLVLGILLALIAYLTLMGSLAHL
jgi:hypothetical protein